MTNITIVKLASQLLARWTSFLTRLIVCSIISTATYEPHRELQWPPEANFLDKTSVYDVCRSAKDEIK